jgi:ubiquinone/menaquinone biosynthesis C-methylase UbiE
MRLITIDDFIDLYSKIKQRGLDYFFSKLTFSKLSRTKSAFNQEEIIHSNWWIIPLVRKRWNKLISGNENTIYEEFLMKEVLSNDKEIRMLSIGSGVCSHELALAEYLQFKEITCVDLAQNRLNEAKKIADKKGLKNIRFECANIFEFIEKGNKYDIVFFHQSLHHFANMNAFIPDFICNSLTNNGKLIINEFVGPSRLQFPKTQIKAINEALAIIPKPFRKRFKTELYKTKFYGSGILRMIQADPTECIDSINIMPNIYHHFDTIVERPYGGNILMNVLKDISHHFVEINSEKEIVLNNLFEFEDNYLKSNTSDFIFGVYQKKKI